jgi:hypothetical protein
MQLPTWLRTLTAGRRSKSRPPRQARGAPTLEALEDRVVPSADFLYVGDGTNNAVQRFDAAAGAALGTFVAGSKSLDGPRGMVFDGHGHFLLVNQNVNRGKPGDIMQYDAATGAYLGNLVSFQDANAPFAPRAMVLKDNVLYVAALQEGSTTRAGTPSGEIDEYNATTGAFLGRTTPPAALTQALADQQFNPRGIAFGPDGNLYVSTFDPANPDAGYVLRLNATSQPGAWSVVAFNNGDTVADPGETADLHRPEGLVFGPDGKLYVTSFRADGNDTDKILVFNAGGTEVDRIALDAVGQPRAYGQALLFGPGGALFVPITGNGPDTGAVRQYDVTAKTYTNFVAPGTMGEPWYLAFGNTDPATLAYQSSAAPSLAALVPAPGSTIGTASTPSTGSNPVAPAVAAVVVVPPAAPTAVATEVVFTLWGDDLFADGL